LSKEMRRSRGKCIVGQNGKKVCDKGKKPKKEKIPKFWGRRKGGRGKGLEEEKGVGEDMTAGESNGQGVVRGVHNQ